MPKKPFQLFPDDAPVEDRDELIRSGLPELTRCDHCDKLDEHTERVEVGLPPEKRWLHPDCSINFIPGWQRCDCYNDGLADGHYFRWIYPNDLAMQDRGKFNEKRISMPRDGKYRFQLPRDMRE